MLENNCFSRFREKIKDFFLLLLQRLLITLQLFNQNGLMNHAAACSYGFLLSAAPALLFIAFVVSQALSASPELAEVMLGQLGALFGIFEAGNLIENFLSSSNSGLAGLVSVVSIFWTARLCALSVQRGLGVVFPGPRSVLRDNAVTLGLGLFAMFVIFITLLGLRFAVGLYNSTGFSSLSIFAPVLILSARIFLMLALALMALAAYRFFPANPPKVKTIIPGVLACIIFFRIFTAAFSLIINPDRYNLLYGTLGRLFLFLVNVYFFFVFFFFGAQLIHALSVSEALLFARFRQVHSMSLPSKSLFDRAFAALPGSLKKYVSFFKKDDTVFAMHSQGHEVYYILSGKAGVYLDSEGRSKVAVVDEMNFFGEMSSFASDSKGGRAASIKAETDLSVLVLPPALFHAILQVDPNTDKSLIKTLSEHLKSANQQISGSRII